MKYACGSVKLFALILFLGLTAFAQTPGNAKRFDKDGLAFDYPNNWTVEDQSNSDAQQLTLGRADLDAQIRLFAHRGKVDTPEKMAQAKTKFIDPYIEATSNSFVQMGAKPTREPATIEIAGAKAEGIRIKAVLDGVPGEAAIYWAMVGNRVIVLTLFGPDTALKQATPAWDAVRSSLRIEDKKPAQKPAPK
ncbi:MAG TPA: hypothetical protein VGC66_05155 [Pyrinomonadaceae bacterium]|jgi:hypothetical protein